MLKILQARHEQYVNCKLPNVQAGFIYLFFTSWRLITLQYCSGFCHTLTWISHGFTCIPHPDPPSHLPLHPIPLGLPSAPGSSTCLMPKLYLEMAEEPEIKSPTTTESSKKQDSSRKISTSASLTTPKPLTVWIKTNCGTFFKRWEILGHLTCLLRNLYAGQEATVRTGTIDWF